jgi:hypothetical protein
MEVSAPAGTHGTIAVPLTGGAPAQVVANGQVVWDGSAFHAGAARGVLGAHADARYVSFDVVGGATYRFEASPAPSTGPQGPPGFAGPQGPSGPAGPPGSVSASQRPDSPRECVPSRWRRGA